jgi:hypothetical protein
MEKNITFSADKVGTFGFSSFISNVSKQISTMIRKYYSSVLGEEVSVNFMHRLIKAQVAFVCAVLPADMPLLLRAAFCLWFLFAVLRCRK